MATTHRTGDFCSIVLAGGSGSQLFPLIQNYPKCLLNVGNYPILYYSLRALEISGFDETIIVVRQPFLEKIKFAIDILKMKIKANFHTISDYIEHNTASVLASMQSLLTCDNVLVLSGDVYGEISLRNMASTYRKRDATFCAYIQPMVAGAKPPVQVPPKLSVANGSTGSQPPSNTFDSVCETVASADFLAFNHEDDRLLICVNECNIEEGLRIQKSLLTEYPRFTIHKDYNDLHTYIIKNTLIKLISTKSLLNFKTDVVTYLVNMQFTDKNSPLPPAPPAEEYEISNTGHVNKTKSEQSGYATKLNGVTLEKPVRCYAHIPPTQSKALRVNTIPTLFAANMMALKLAASKETNKPMEKVNMLESRDFIVGVNSKVSSTEKLIRSVVGRNCRIGFGCKITNSVIFDNVTIMDNCLISDSIIGHDATVEENCKILQCIVGTKEIVCASGNLTKRIIAVNQDRGR